MQLFFLKICMHFLSPSVCICIHNRTFLFLWRHSINTPIVHLMSYSLLPSHTQSLNSKHFQLLPDWSTVFPVAVFSRVGLCCASEHNECSFHLHTVDIFQDCVHRMSPPHLFVNVGQFLSHSLLSIWWILKRERKVLHPQCIPSWIKSPCTDIRVSKKTVRSYSLWR